MWNAQTPGTTPSTSCFARLGQGSSLALVGAFVLAGELARGMVLKSRMQIRIQMLTLRLCRTFLAKDRFVGRIANAIHDAATAIAFETY